MRYFLGIILYAGLLSLLQACNASRKNKASDHTAIITNSNPSAKRSSVKVSPVFIDTKNVNPDDVVDFAKTLIGVKYQYGSAIKEQGFDCSGFITYVLNHFDIKVPRVSKDFTNAGTEIPLSDSKKGDLILFTGTDTTGWIVGHMGMITENNNGAIKFIHSSSGKSVGVIISSLSGYYATRFVKAIRIFTN